MTKLLYIISDDSYFLSHRLDLARQAKSSGFDVRVLAYKNSEKFVAKITAEGFEFMPLSLRAHGLGFFANIKLIGEIRRAISEIKPDLIHTVSMRMVFLTTIAFWLSSAKKMVATLTGMGFLETSKKRSTRLIKALVLGVFKWLFKSKGVHLVVQNTDDYAAVKNRLIETNRLHLVKGSGVNLEDFPALEFPDFATIHVSFVARMLKDKGLLELVEAARILRARGLENIQIHLIGEPHEVNPFSVAKQQLLDWNAESLVKWHGFRSDIVNVWKESHIAVLPSYREGLPKSLLEAAACGRPIITTDVAGCREVVNGENGVLVEVRSPQAIADAIVQLSASSEKIMAMGKASRSLVEAEFSSEIVNEKMLQIYEMV